MRRERRRAKLLPAISSSKTSLHPSDPASITAFAEVRGRTHSSAQRSVATLAVLLGGVLLSGMAASPTNAAVSFTDDPDFSVEITAGESVSITCSAGDIQVTVNAAPTVFTTECAAATSLSVTATGDFTNDIDLTGVSAASFPSLTLVSIDGGGGVDDLKGSELGDTARGGTGADTFQGQGGDDVFTWDPGDGSDLVIGGTGSDTLVFNGSTGDEIFTLNPDGARFEFLRNLGTIDMAVESTETLKLFGLGGDDSLTVNDLTGVADLTSAQISMGDGADTVDASAQANAAVALTINGDGGNDNLTGSRNADVIDGGADNDTAFGKQGADTFLGQDGDDVFTWDPGDGSDLVIGGNGNDTLVFNGSAGNEIFTLSPDGARFEFLRNLGSIDMAVESTETLQLFGLGGDDSLTVNDLTGVADLTSAQISMGDGADTVDASAQANAAVALTINGDGGNDNLTGSRNADVIDGGADNDTAFGKQGADTFLGQDGDDVFTWDPGDGSDLIVGGDGSDTLVFNGSTANEVFTVSADAAGFGLTRDVGNIVMDVESTESLVLAALEGDDVVWTVGLPNTSQSFDGGAHLAYDQLNIDAQGAGVVTSEDSVQVDGAQLITFVNFEQLDVANAGQVVNALPSRSSALALLAAGLLVTATARLRRRRSQ